MAKPYQPERVKEQFWRRTLRLWQRSGLTIRDFCRQQGLAEPNFYAWRRTLAQREQATGSHRPPDRRAKQATTLGRPSPATSPSRPAAFVPVAVVADRPTTVEVVLGQGRVVRVAAGFDPALLLRVLQVLEGASC